MLLIIVTSVAVVAIVFMASLFMGEAVGKTKNTAGFATGAIKAVTADRSGGDGQMAIASETGQRMYVYNGGLVASIKGTETTYYMQDFLSSNSLSTNKAGIIQSRSLSYPYGKTLSLSSNSGGVMKYKFTGKEDDGKLMYFGARYMDPRRGQFISVDPITRIGTNYAYANDNPLAFVDPSGMSEVEPEKIEPLRPIGGDSILRNSRFSVGSFFEHNSQSQGDRQRFSGLGGELYSKFNVGKLLIGVSGEASNPSYDESEQHAGPGGDNLFSTLRFGGRVSLSRSIGDPRGGLSGSFSGSYGLYATEINMLRPEVTIPGYDGEPPSTIAEMKHDQRTSYQSGSLTGGASYRFGSWVGPLGPLGDPIRRFGASGSVSADAREVTSRWHDSAGASGSSGFRTRPHVSASIGGDVLFGRGIGASASIDTAGGVAAGISYDGPVNVHILNQFSKDQSPSLKLSIGIDK